MPKQDFKIKRKGIGGGASLFSSWQGNMDRAMNKFQKKRIVHLKAAVALDSWVKRNFNAEGRRHEDSTLHWKPLSPITIARRKHGGSTILQDTGNLRRNWEHRATNRAGFLKSRQDYSGAHEEGIGVPQRKIFPTQKQGTALVLPIFKQYVRDAAK